MHTLSDDIDFLKFLGNQESQFITSASAFKQGVLDRINGEGGVKGDLMPWSKTHGCVALRPGEVSIWGGYNGHGKSQLLNQVCAWGLKTSRWLIASMEMKPEATLHRMVRQIAGVKRFTQVTRENFSTGRTIDYIGDQLDTVKQERILGMVHYCAQELGIKHIVIDSLMKCGIPTDDLNAQKQFVDRLCWAAKTENIHIHIVHHMRKGVNESQTPGKHDFRGAGETTDLVDNVFIVHRNKDKEEKIRTGREVDDDSPDCTLSVMKQRHGEWEGVFKLWFNVESMQFTPDKHNKPIPFVFNM